ncbi:MAG: xanthine dehydrogenase molybdopterin binding subunit [Bacteroidetes bacterium]|nr:MAG: xanthine dehydrogenase molybdopterin binding subunit [Bacteroidota bacterium]REK04734.1 MAG: xanthine dehydrogenase molybdopterin binding subunit [Bacteroidota bacterium]REK36208.1 MAG: xanthine dehydrogenase molybdopterin binding subunit [Bacteroidota bacterium]REK51421.1 MAG: xanthine dehydrogenase molybdopterin binding subunit [Bacteroidota bacterium]
MNMKLNIPHDSAAKHVSGKSVYIDDIPMPSTILHGRVVYSKHAHAKILKIDTAEAKKIAGVHAILSWKDIPGQNQMGPVVHDEPCLAESEVICVGQAIVLIAAETESAAIEAEKLIRIQYEVLEAVTDLRSAISRNLLLAPERTMKRGDPEQELLSCKHRIVGEIETGAQEHWYLETQSCLCIPGEGNEMNVFSSTQHPSETQAIVAEVLGLPKNEIVVETRRMGGAFGGKETQANHTAAWTALLAYKTGRPVKIRLFRDDDQKITGKRHPFIIQYEAGFDHEGKIHALIVDQHTDAGCATDLSMAILERAMLHADNCYFIPHMLVRGKAYRTNLPSNTAFRGFGGPQGMAGIEQIMDRIARQLKTDSEKIRKLNFYKHESNNVTHYGQKVELNRLDLIYDQIKKSSDYDQRRKEINRFNQTSPYVKKGMAMTPVKFGISFTTSFLNQAGALVNLYKDGTLLVNHGGTEMGQGLHTKIAQIAAAEMGVTLDKVKVNATNTSKVPNTSATAASAGTDLNGMAVKDAIEKIKRRLAILMVDEFNKKRPEKITNVEHILFQNNSIIDSLYPDRKISLDEACVLAHLNQVSLSATGFYKTPNIGWDKVKGWGKPFNYFAFGMAVSEVLVDTLTGYVKHLRTDILHDVGDTINEGIDIGQIEGGFIQGLGWVTTEEVKHDKAGNLLNHSPDTYKIPAVTDMPEDFRVSLLKNVPNPNAIRKSKAVAEPPFMLAMSTWLAIKDAISSVADHKLEPMFKLPATNELILLSVEDIKQRMKIEKAN